MKRRMIRFVSGQGWFYSPIFPGDATELARVSSEVSCDKTWSQIAAVMAKVKTMDEFKRGIIWAQKQYHIPEPRPVTQTMESRPDELLTVYEDLSVTGVGSEAVCTSCKMETHIAFKPDGTFEGVGLPCLVCGGALVRVNKDLPDEAFWRMLLQICRVKPGVYTIAKDAAMKDKAANQHVGQEISRIEKLVKVTKDNGFYQVVFKDRTCAIVPLSAFRGNPDCKEQDIFLPDPKVNSMMEVSV